MSELATAGYVTIKLYMGVGVYKQFFLTATFYLNTALILTTLNKCVSQTGKRYLLCYTGNASKYFQFTSKMLVIFSGKLPSKLPIK